MAAPWKKCEVGYFQELFSGLRILTTSLASRQNLSEDETQQLMDNVLHQNLVSFASWLTKCEPIKVHTNMYTQLIDLVESPVDDVRRKYADLLTYILNHVTDLSQTDTSTEEKTNEDSVDLQESDFFLSSDQEKVVSTSLQFVIVLGISPYLSEGVGIPISYRLGPGQILLASAFDYSRELSEVKRLQYLLPPLHLLVNALNSITVRKLLVNNHLSDLFTTLIQVRRTAKIVIHQQMCTFCEEKVFHPESRFEKSAEKREQKQSLSPSSSSLSSPSLSSSSSTASSNFIDIGVIGKFLANYNCGSSMQDLMSYCNVELDNVFTQQNLPTLLQEMMTLAGLNKARPNTKTAPWFQRVIISIISQLIIKPSGVLQFISSFVSESTVNDTKNWKTCEAMAKIISQFPVLAKEKKMFYTSVSQQLVDIINDYEKPLPQMVIGIVGEAISQLDDLHKDLTKELCLSPMRAPLQKCCSYEDARSNGDVLVSEKELLSSINRLHRLYVQGLDYQSSFCSTLQPVIGVIFAIFKHAKNGVSQLRSLTKDLLSRYVSCLESSKGVTCLLELLAPSSEKHSLYPSLCSDLVLLSGSESGFKVVVSSDSDTTGDINSWTQSSEAVLELLNSAKSESLTSDLFMSLLQRLSSLIGAEVSTSDDIILPVHCMSLESKSAKLKELQSRTALVSLISAIGETYGHAVVANTHHVLLFTQVTLSRCLQIIQASDDGTTLSFETDTVTMAMGLLMATLSVSPQLSDEDKQILDEVLPMLSTFSSYEAMPFHVKEMADNLKVVVATRGRVWPDLNEPKKEKESVEKDEEIQLRVNDENKVKSKRKPLIEVLSENVASENSQNSRSNAEGKPEANSPRSKLQQAIEDVKSPLVPVQGHGLISLSRMLEDRQSDAVQHKDMLFKIFMNNLSHLDSYIYLATINGLSALSDLCPDDVVPCLASEFRQSCLKDQSSTTMETTLKVGEALVKATHRLGEMTPKYRDVLLPAVLCGCRHDNEFVRASCLSGLSEVCKLLRFTINPVLHEVLACCRDIIKSDPCSEPRRAAGLTITSLLQGLGKYSLETLSSGMKELYQALKHAVNFDTDDKVKVHATLALNQLDDIMKDILFPQQKLQKRISILGYK